MCVRLTQRLSYAGAYAFGGPRASRPRMASVAQGMSSRGDRFSRGDAREDGVKPRCVRPARSRRLAVVVFVVVLLATGAALAAWEGLGLVPAHDVRRAVAQPDATLTAREDQEIAGVAATVPGILDATLRVTGGALHFGLNHRTSLRFTSVEREGNCVEYAQLFATLFNRAAHAKGMAARAWPVRSQARFFGARTRLGSEDGVSS